MVMRQKVILRGGGKGLSEWRHAASRSIDKDSRRGEFPTGSRSGWRREIAWDSIEYGAPECITRWTF